MNIHTPVAYPFEWTLDAGAISLDRLLKLREEYRDAGLRVVTTNGCFDLLHPGHVRFLQEARSLGDVLIVALNSDTSVRRLKGAERPIIPEIDRATMLALLRSVDHVVIFDDLLPNNLLALLQPDFHCKAADYTPDVLPEAEVIHYYGGEIRILPFVEGYSTSQLIRQVIDRTETTDCLRGREQERSDRETWVTEQLLTGANVLRQVAYQMNKQILLAATKITETLSTGKKILLCGNGGSAADAQHIAAEFVGRFRRERRPLPAIALTTDTSILTALGNDYGFEQIFVRQVAALGQPGDILLGLSTSGTSRNVLAAVETARAQGVYTIALTGKFPSSLSNRADLSLAVPSKDTPLVQQAHIAILHTICDITEQMLSEDPQHSV